MCYREIGLQGASGIELDLTDKKLELRFSRGMVRMMASEELAEKSRHDPAAALEYISLETVKWVKKISGSKKGGKRARKNGWSPQFIGMKCYLLMLTEMRRHLTGAARRRKWMGEREEMLGTEHLVASWIAGVTRSMTLATASPEENRDSIQDILGVTGFGPQHWLEFAGDRLQKVEEETDRIKACVQGNRRRELRRSINKRVNHREDLREAGKIGKVIKSVLGTQREFFGMDSVRDLRGNLVTDAVDIFNTFGEFWEEWYAAQDTYNGKFLHAERQPWLHLRDSKEEFRRKVQAMDFQIPEKYIDQIYEGMVDVPREEALRRRMDEILQVAPSYEEFADSIATLHKGTAAGMSGLSFNMISRWPEQTLHVVYDLLRRIWDSKEVPAFWKWKWLVPIPKVNGISDLDKMRPIMLMETTRKLWGRLIMRKIQKVWTDMEALSEAQHGGLAGRGTSTALMQTINMTEDAVEWHRKLHLASWDMKKAFDAVSRTAMVLGWERLGIPPDIAEWLGGMDEDGMVVTRTPAAQDKLRLRGRRAFNRKDGTYPSVQGFRSAKGTPQGDVSSPMNWVAIFDILLRALEKASDGKYTIQGEQEGEYDAPDQAYMDDLITPAATHAAIQERANIISAFCIIFGISLSRQKFRKLAINGDLEAPVVVYGPGWVEVALPEQDGASMVNLGLTADTKYTGKLQLDLLQKAARQHCGITQRSKASSTTKMMVYKTSIIRKLAYAGKFLPVSLTALRSLDKIGDGFIRAITKATPSWPAALLYGDHAQGGAGFTRISDAINSDKYGEMVRGLAGGPRMRRTMEGLLRREGRARSGSTPGAFPSTFRGTRRYRRTWWATSLIQWCAEKGIYLTRAGSATPGLDEDAVTALNDDVAGMFRRQGIEALRDIIAWNGTEYVWAIPEVLCHLPEAQAILDISCPQMPLELDVGHFLWDPAEEGTERSAWSVIRIYRDQTPVQVVLQHWLGKTRTSRWLCTEGPAFAIDEDDVLAFDWTRLMVYGTGGQAKEVMAEHKVNVIGSRAETTDPPDWIESGGWLGGNDLCHIYSDGSWREEALDIAGALQQHHDGREATGGLVLLPDRLEEGWKHKVRLLRVTHGEDIGARSAYTMEFLMATAAAQISRWRDTREATFSDCKSVVNMLAHAASSAIKSSASHSLLLQSAARDYTCGAVRVEWVRSHPEKRKARANWSGHDWGIFLADYAAAGKWEALRKLGFVFVAQSVTAEDIYASTLSTGQWYWSDKRGLPIGVPALRDTIRATIMPKYVVDRDGYRSDAGKAQEHYDSSLEHIGLVWDFATGPPASKTRKGRLVWNKGWTGENRGKGAKDAAERAEQEACRLCGARDTQHHWLQECQWPEAITTRETVMGSLHRAIVVQLAGAAPWLGRAGEYMIRSLGGDQGSRLWVSNWSGPAAAGLGRHLGQWDLTDSQGTSLRKALVTYGKICAEGVGLLWDVKVRGERAEERVRQGGKRALVRSANDSLRLERASRSMREGRARHSGIGGVNRPKESLTGWLLRDAKRQVERTRFGMMVRYGRSDRPGSSAADRRGGYTSHPAGRRDRPGALQRA